MTEVSNVPAGVSDDELFETVLIRLESLVRDEGKGGYVLTVLAAEDSEDTMGKGKRRIQPGVAWWLMRWRRVPRG